MVHNEPLDKGMALTPEQKARIEKNRLAALARKRAVESSVFNNGRAPPSSPQPLSQDSNSSVASADSAKRVCITNPYKLPSPFKNRPERRSPDPLSQESLEDRRRTFEAEEAERRERELLPPCPVEPVIREVTVQSLSEQQLEVVKLARPPTPVCICNDKNGMQNEQQSQQQPGYMVRVTAAAGTGKTTTLLHLAVRCLDLGHTNVTYVTFARASAADAKRRILDMMKVHGHDCTGSESITASTLHACAMQLVNDETADDVENKLIEDTGLERIIEREYRHDIDRYIEPALRQLKNDSQRQIPGNEGSSRETQQQLKDLHQKDRVMRKQVVYYLKKTFLNFVHSNMSIEQLKTENYWSRHWYPIRSAVFSRDGQATKLGFPPEIYSRKESYRFYADTCVKFWEYLVEHNVRTYDTEMKKAQLRGLRIPCTVLLVDECQDLDACQVAFIAKQKIFGTQVFFVGDSAQSIYSFRGAKSSNVMSLPDCIDKLLTKSWRFGAAIAQVANISLFVKENSPQTTNYVDRTDKQWIPYRVDAAREEDYSIVSTRSLLHRDWWNKRPVTIIGRKNGTLLKIALELMDLGHLEHSGAMTDAERSMGLAAIETDSNELEMLLAKSMPKFHINGKGETSGARAWRKSIKEIKHLYQLYIAGEKGGTLPPRLFPQFADYGSMTWDDFFTAFHNLELNQYFKSVEVVLSYGKNTMKAIKVFEAQLDAKHSPEDADFILTTCHSAKGLEWDHVEICDDFLNLQQRSYAYYNKKQLCTPFLCFSDELPVDAKLTYRNKWQHDIECYGDDLNFIYVACTRAKKTLSLPKTIENLLREFDLIHFIVNDFKNARKKPLESDESMITLEKGKRKLSKGEVWNLYHDLCVPLRKELGIDDENEIMSFLFDVKEDEGDAEPVVKSEEDKSQLVDC